MLNVYSILNSQHFKPMLELNLNLSLKYVKSLG